jgi:hypothetical protein
MHSADCCQPSFRLCKSVLITWRRQSICIRRLEERGGGEVGGLGHTSASGTGTSVSCNRLVQLSKVGEVQGLDHSWMLIR